MIEQLKNEEFALLRTNELEREQELYNLRVEEIKSMKKILEDNIHEKENILQEKQLQSFSFIQDIAEQQIESFRKELDIQKQKSLNELSKNNESEEVSLEKLEQILNELDPNEVYTKLTSGEIDENNFPVEKAVVWFSALKKAMDQ